MQEPLYPHASLGYRCWRIAVGEAGPRLHPLKRSGNRGPLPCWHPGLNQADCFAFGSLRELEHQPPVEHCQCGIHAYYSYKAAKLQCSWSQARSALDSKFVYGIIAGAGPHQLHVDGFRCRQAIPLGLFKPYLGRAHRNLIEAVAEYYQIPTFSNRRQAAAHVRQTGALEVPLRLRPTRESQAAYYPPPSA